MSIFKRKFNKISFLNSYILQLLLSNSFEHKFDKSDIPIVLFSKLFDCNNLYDKFKSCLN